jgi:hypothetical protein
VVDGTISHEVHLGPQKFGFVLLLFAWSLLPLAFAFVTFLFQDHVQAQNYLLLTGLVLQLVGLLLASEKTPNRLLARTVQWRFSVFFCCLSMLIALGFERTWPSTSMVYSSNWWLPLMFALGSAAVTYATLNTASSSPRIAIEASCEAQITFDFSSTPGWTIESGKYKQGVIASFSDGWDTLIAIIGGKHREIDDGYFIRLVAISSSSFQTTIESFNLEGFTMDSILKNQASRNEES